MSGRSCCTACSACRSGWRSQESRPPGTCTSSIRRCRPGSPARPARSTTLLENKYYFDRFNAWFFAGGARALGAFLSRVGDLAIIDGFFVNGSARVVGWTASLMRHIQSGFVYHYAFTMIVGVFALLTWWTR